MKLNDLHQGHPGFIALFGDQVVAADLKIDLERFSQATKGAYGNAKEVEARFRRSSDSTEIEHHQETLIAYSNIHRNIWRWCTECAEEDMLKKGITYWRHRLQHPCYLACLEHQMALTQINLPYRNRQSRFISPSEAYEIPHARTCCDIDLPIGLEITRIAAMLFDSEIYNSEGYSQIDLHKDEAWQARVRRATKVLAPQDQNHQALITKLVSNRRPSGDYFPLAIYASFSNINIYLEYLRWAEVFNCCANTITNEDKATLRNTHRRTCQNYLKSARLPNRSEFWQQEPMAARWLMKHDKIWFTENIPLQTSRIHQFKLFDLL